MSRTPLELQRAVAVGRTTPRSVRLWMRSPGGGPHQLELWPDAAPPARRTFRFDMGHRTDVDHTHVLVFPDDVPGAPPLEPVTRYGFRILNAGEVPVGEGRFETTPATRAQMPETFSLGLASCHQPFDPDGQQHERGRRMLRVARVAWERAAVKKVLWAGDQLYVDYPPTRSLFDAEYFHKIGPPGRVSILDCTGEETLEMYHARYRHNWGQPEWLELQARFPGYPILDDHEVVDNFGTLPEHHTERWRNIRQAAGAAYRHYQHWRVAPSPADGDGPYDYSWEYGSVVGYTLDVRSMRRSADGDHARVFAPHQLEHFAAWLNANAHAPVAFVMMSVPPFFMPTWMSRLASSIPGGSFREDAHDRWTHPQYRKDRERMLRLIRDHQGRHPKQRVVLLAGDVHVGYLVRCDWRSDPPTCLYEFVSSSITHALSSMDWHFARHLPRTHFVMRDVGDRYARIHLAGSRFSRILQQPVGGLNVGIVDIRLEGDSAKLNFRLFGEDEKTPDEPKLLFESGWE